MREQEQDEQTTSPPLEASVAKEQSPATTTSAATQPHREQLVDSQLQHTSQHQEQTTVQDTHNVQQRTQSLPPGGNHNGQDKFEKRASVSERRKMFEPPFGAGGGVQDKKFAIRAREKTPGHPAGQEKDKNTNISSQQSSTPLSHKQGDPNPPKRFSFVPKHVAPYDDARLPADTETKSVVPKRSSSDGRTNISTVTTKNMTNKSLFFSSSANEIREPKHLNDTKTSTDYHEHSKQKQKTPPVEIKATTPPVVKKPQRATSAQNFQLQVTVPQQTQQVNHDESLHESMSSSTAGGNNTSVLSSSTSESVSSGFTTPDSSLLSDRSNSIVGFSRLHSEDAEAKRRVTAKKKREARRVTQPVDNELLRLISKEDAEHEQHEDELQTEAEQLADKLKPKVNVLSNVCVCVCVCVHACVHVCVCVYASS